MPEKDCPKCGDDITDTYESSDPEAGILNSSWHCDRCNLTVYRDLEPWEDDIL